MELMPSLQEHHCSEGAAGGFLSRVKEGTWLGHVAEHVAIEIQHLIGIPVSFGRTRETKTPASTTSSTRWRRSGSACARASWPSTWWSSAPAST